MGGWFLDFPSFCFISLKGLKDLVRKVVDRVDVIFFPVDPRSISRV